MAPNATRDSHSFHANVDILGRFSDMGAANLDDTAYKVLGREMQNGANGAEIRFEDQRLDRVPAGSSDDDLALEGRPKRVVIFVEPSPWAYTSGYKNRYQNFIRFLQEQGDEVLVITTHEGAPKEWFGARVVPSYSVEFPFYQKLRLSLALSFRIYNIVKDFKPDVIHVTTPGLMVFGSLIYSCALQVPIIMTYHTHLPSYIPKYKILGLSTNWLVNPAYLYIRACHNLATFTMTMSQEMRQEMMRFGAARASRIGVWEKAVDSEQFHPSFASAECRNKLTGGHPERPLIVHVGRLGQEKQLSFIKLILARIPEASLAFVGDGPHRPQLEEMFADTPTVFTGMLSGADLSAAYASADVFFTPSTTETLGLVALEAMACGTPVVAARAGGFINIVDKEGETGFLYTPGDIDDAVGKLRKLLFDEDFNKKIAAAARKDVERYDWRASTRQVRRDGYDMAIRLWRKAQKARQSWTSWLPWTWFTKID